MPVASEPKRTLVMQWSSQHLDHGAMVTDANAKNADIRLLGKTQTSVAKASNLPSPSLLSKQKHFVL